LQSLSLSPKITDLQRDALLAAVRRQPAPLFEDNASGAKDDRLGLNQARSRDTSRQIAFSSLSGAKFTETSQVRRRLQI
jgi:hypothetical protein